MSLQTPSLDQIMLHLSVLEDKVHNYIQLWKAEQNGECCNAVAWKWCKSLYLHRKIDKNRPCFTLHVYYFFSSLFLQCNLLCRTWSTVSQKNATSETTRSKAIVTQGKSESRNASTVYTNSQRKVFLEKKRRRKNANNPQTRRLKKVLVVPVSQSTGDDIIEDYHRGSVGQKFSTGKPVLINWDTKQILVKMQVYSESCSKTDNNCSCILWGRCSCFFQCH